MVCLLLLLAYYAGLLQSQSGGFSGEIDAAV